MADLRDVYKKYFQSSNYVNDYLGKVDWEYKWSAEEFYHRLFSQGKLSGTSLIDLGCGPTVRAALVASKYIPEIYNADLLEQNRNFVKKWLRNEEITPDFSKQFKYVAQLEGQSSINYLEERVRKSVKDVLSCDILLDNPFHPDPLRQFDIVASSLCLDCYDNEENYLKGAKGIASLVRPGGYLALHSSLNCKSYYVGDMLFPASNVNGAIAKEVFTKAGLKVLEVDEFQTTTPTLLNADFNGYFTLFAIKV